MGCWTCVDWNITEPANGVVWTNGQANLISWSKALDDGVSQFDIELQRLSTSGLTYVAHLGTCIFRGNLWPCHIHFSTSLPVRLGKHPIEASRTYLFALQASSGSAGVDRPPARLYRDPPSLSCQGTCSNRVLTSCPHSTRLREQPQCLYSRPTYG